MRKKKDIEYIDIDDILLKSSETLKELKKKKEELYSSSWGCRHTNL